ADLPPKNDAIYFLIIKLRAPPLGLKRQKPKSEILNGFLNNPQRGLKDKNPLRCLIQREGG
ncbi:hypothetical protein CJ307_32375, partial [Klebsiella quasipneumoniae]